MTNARTRIATVAIGALVAGAVAVPMAPAMALAADPSGAAATAFADRLGHDRTAGIFFDGAGQLTIAVTDQNAAAAVRTAGGHAELVTHDADRLDAVKAEFDASAPRIPGTSWGVDARGNRVSVEADSSVSAADFARLRAFAAPYGDAVSLTRIGGRDQVAADPFTSGGQGIYNSVSKCSLGFNVRNSAGKRYFLTAGHCAVGAGTAYYKVSGGTPLGRLHEADYGSRYGNDFAIVEYTNSNVSAFGTVWVNGAEEQISSSGTAYVGQKVQRAGTNSTDLIGEVTSIDDTRIFDDGGVTVTLTGLIRTTHCSEAGDSGGPLFAGTKALGTLATGNMPDGMQCGSNSPNNYRSSFQPVQEVLNHAGLSVY